MRLGLNAAKSSSGSKWPNGTAEARRPGPTGESGRLVRMQDYPIGTAQEGCRITSVRFGFKAGKSSSGSKWPNGTAEARRPGPTGESGRLVRMQDYPIGTAQAGCSITSVRFGLKAAKSSSGSKWPNGTAEARSPVPLAKVGAS